MSGFVTEREPTSESTRLAISDAALLVNVTARIESGCTPTPSIKCAIRYVMTRVLPLPAPARISTGPSVVSTASRCCGFSLDRYEDKFQDTRKAGSPRRHGEHGGLFS